ncbi:hypothetical protein [Mesorhizobium sp. BE184]|nr:hypothetical protein [Mesorhizobium sp. BE184]MDR7032010.1 hypothetical protein [Mesorhizobium sp. BE184]
MFAVRCSNATAVPPAAKMARLNADLSISALEDIVAWRTLFLNQSPE